MCNMKNIMGSMSRVHGRNGRGFQSPELVGAEGKGERGESGASSLPGGKKAVNQSGGAGPEAAVPSPRWQEAEEAV